MSTREAFFERKLECLERRLTRIEKFVEVRFEINAKRSGSEGRARHEEISDLSSDDNVEEDVQDEAKARDKKLPSPRLSSKPSKVNDSTRRRRNSPGKTYQSKEASTVTSKPKYTMKQCFVRIMRQNHPEGSASLKDTPSPSTPKADPYGTRRQTRIAEAAKKPKPNCKVNVAVKHKRNNDGENEDLDAVGKEDKSTSDEYFVYPSAPGHEHPDDDAPDEVGDDGDNDYCPADDANLENDSVEEAKEAGSGKRKLINQDPKPKKRKRYRPNPKNRVNYTKKFGTISMSRLSSDLSKIVSTDPTRGECPICRGHFIHELLPIHVATHAKERHLKCSKCDKKFWKRETLNKHVLTVHDMDNYKRRCRHCGKPIVGNLLGHEQFCLRRAWEKDEEIDPKLLEEIRTRMQQLGREFVLPEKPTNADYDPSKRKECPTCRKSFLLKFYERHVQSHDKARNWKCSKCPKAYIFKHDLVRHIIQTHEIIPTCEHCKATFKSRNDLHLHKVKVCEKDKRKLKMAKVMKSKEDKQDTEAEADTHEIDKTSVSKSEKESQVQMESRISTAEDSEKLQVDDQMATLECPLTL